MGILRALSTTKGRRGGYDKLIDETNEDSNAFVGNRQQTTPVLKRVVSVPAQVLFGSSSRKIKTTSSSYSSSSSWERNIQANTNNINNNCNNKSKKQQETNEDSNAFVGNRQQTTPVLKRVVSVPARVLFGSSSRRIKTTSSSYSSSSSSWERNIQANTNNININNNKSKKQHEMTKAAGKVHPVFGLFDGRSWSKRKFTSNPEFSRYIDYLKEGGVGLGAAAAEQGR